MKTLLITLEYPPFKGGVANYYFNLASHYPYQETFLVLNNNDKQLDSGHGFFSWRLAFGTLIRKITRSHIDYVLVGQILPLGTATYLLSFIKPFRYGVFFHGLDFSAAIKIRRKKFLTKLILGRANKIIAGNSYVASMIEREWPKLKEKISVVNPGLPSASPVILPADLQKIKAEYNLAGKTIFFSLGRLVKRKGFDMAIKALAEMSETDLSDLLYVIAGAGKEETYLHSLVPAKLKDKIIFLGALSEEDKWRWLKLCDIFVMPARDLAGDYEGFGIVYLEANLLAKPVIAGAAGGVSDAVIDGYNGLLVDPESTGAIKEAMIKLKNNPELRDKLGRQGELRAKNEFSWDKLANDLFNIISR
jgi:phosphatidylinositol alpha-1,6-mannosyltransferase